MKIYKTKLYRVTYKTSGGVDTYSGNYLLNTDWIKKLIESGKAIIERIK